MYSCGLGILRIELRAAGAEISIAGAFCLWLSLAFGNPSARTSVGACATTSAALLSVASDSLALPSFGKRCSQLQAHFATVGRQSTSGVREPFGNKDSSSQSP